MCIKLHCVVVHLDISNIPSFDSSLAMLLQKYWTPLLGLPIWAVYSTQCWKFFNCMVYQWRIGKWTHLANSLITVKIVCRQLLKLEKSSRGFFAAACSDFKMPSEAPSAVEDNTLTLLSTGFPCVFAFTHGQKCRGVIFHSACWVFANLKQN